MRACAPEDVISVGLATASFERGQKHDEYTDMGSMGNGTLHCAGWRDGCPVSSLGCLPARRLLGRCGLWVKQRLGLFRKLEQPPTCL